MVVFDSLYRPVTTIINQLNCKLLIIKGSNYPQINFWNVKHRLLVNPYVTLRLIFQRIVPMYNLNILAPVEMFGEDQVVQQADRRIYEQINTKRKRKGSKKQVTTVKLR